MTARLAYLAEVQRLLPSICKNAVPLMDERYISFTYPDHVKARQAAASALLGDHEEQLFGSGASTQEDDHYGSKSRALAQQVSKGSAWARARAARYDLLASHRPLSGWLPAGSGVDGELSKQLASVLVARRKAWEFAGTKGREGHIDGDGWRRIFLGDPKIYLSLPTGAYHIFREVVTGAAEGLNDFRGTVVLDNELASRGGLFRIEQTTASVWRLVGLTKKISALTVTRALLRENGRFLRREIIRRLRDGGKTSFSSGTSRRYADDPITKVTLTAGRKSAENAVLLLRADRLKALAERHDDIVKRIEEAGRELARQFAAQPKMIEMEVRARYEQADEAFESARDRYNAAARQFCLKREIGDLPLSTPPEVFPRRRSLGIGDTTKISRAEREFRDRFAELKEAKATMLSVFGASAFEVAPPPPSGESPAAPPCASAQPVISRTADLGPQGSLNLLFV